MQNLTDDRQGQLPIEFVIVMGITVVLLFPLIMGLMNSNELNQAMSASRAGALQGALYDGLAIYPDDAYRDYIIKHPRLVNPSGVKITKIYYSKEGFNQSYQKTKIQLKIHASAPSVIDESDRNCLGDRINYYARKKICESFHTQNLTNSVFNPAFSDNYVFTTADVCWE